MSVTNMIPYYGHTYTELVSVIKNITMLREVMQNDQQISKIFINIIPGVPRTSGDSWHNHNYALLLNIHILFSTGWGSLPSMCTTTDHRIIARTMLCRSLSASTSRMTFISFLTVTHIPTLVFRTTSTPSKRKISTIFREISYVLVWWVIWVPSLRIV